MDAVGMKHVGGTRIEATGGKTANKKAPSGALRKIERKNGEKTVLECACTLTCVLCGLFIYGVAGSLECEYLTLSEAVRLILGAAAVAFCTYGLKRALSAHT